MNRIALLFCSFLVFAPLSDASAKPKRADGGECESVGTARKDGKDQNGKTVNCKWDTCTFSECTTRGGVSNCAKKTEYSNPTDCKPVAKTGINSGASQQSPSDTMAEPSRPPATGIPRPEGTTTVEPRGKRGPRITAPGRAGGELETNR